MNKQKMISLAKKLHDTHLNNVSVVSVFAVIALTLFASQILGNDLTKFVATLVAFPTVMNVAYMLYMRGKPSEPEASAADPQRELRRYVSEWEKLAIRERRTMK